MSNKNRQNPLDDAFDIESDPHMDDIDPDAEIIIPEIKDLDLVIDFALRNYKELLDDCAMMDLKTQLKARELARDFLREAKDAIDKRDKLKVAWERIQRGGKAAQGASQAGDGEEGGQPQGGGVSRAELTAQAQAARMRRVK